MVPKDRRTRAPVGQDLSRFHHQRGDGFGVRECNLHIYRADFSPKSSNHPPDYRSPYPELSMGCNEPSICATVRVMSVGTPKASQWVYQVRLSSYPLHPLRTSPFQLCPL